MKKVISQSHDFDLTLRLTETSLTLGLHYFLSERFFNLIFLYFNLSPSMHGKFALQEINGNFL
jgi:hypothetical protein